MKTDMPQLVTDSKMPKILWHQTDYFVKIHIQLIDVDKFYLRIDRDQLLFNTIVDDSVYCVVLTFFGAVVPEQSRVTNTGRQIKINIVKGHKGVNWLRLEKDQAKNHMIHVDPDKIIEEETKRNKFLFDWESGTSVKEYKRLHNIVDLAIDEPFSDIEVESEDEIFDSCFE